jgi:hypothetical protein
MDERLGGVIGDRRVQGRPAGPPARRQVRRHRRARPSRALGPSTHPAPVTRVALGTRLAVPGHDRRRADGSDCRLTAQPARCDRGPQLGRRADRRLPRARCRRPDPRSGRPLETPTRHPAGSGLSEGERKFLARERTRYSMLVVTGIDLKGSHMLLINGGMARSTPAWLDLSRRSGACG